MLDQLKEYISNEKLISQNDRILVGMSGGVDSIVLAEMLLNLDFEIEVGHVNYQLRGNDSEEDEKFIKDWCKKRNVQGHFRRLTIDSKGESLQMAARGERYSWFQELIYQKNLTKIATAHHLDDSFETLLLNLVKGAGLTGLRGIQVRRDKIIRPLLCFSKSQILEYAKMEGLHWCQDATNFENKYQRNVIRNEVLPKLKELNPALIETYSRTYRRLVASEELIQAIVRKVELSVKWDEDVLEIPLTWRKVNDGDAEILYRLLRPFNVQFQMVMQILESKESGRVFKSYKYSICLDRDRLIVSPDQLVDGSNIQMDTLGSLFWRNLSVNVSIEKYVAEISNSTNVALLDAAKVKFPILIRSWEKGDAFIPLGMKGKKKISDFMIDLKIPLTLKRNIPIFVIGNQIAWVGGYRIDDRFKITKDTREVLRIELMNNG